MATIIVVRTTTSAYSKKGELRKKCYLHTTSSEQVTREFPEVLLLRSFFFFFSRVCRYSSSFRISSLQSFSIQVSIEIMSVCVLKVARMTSCRLFILSVRVRLHTDRIRRGFSSSFFSFFSFRRKLNRDVIIFHSVLTDRCAKLVFLLERTNERDLHDKSRRPSIASRAIGGSLLSRTTSWSRRCLHGRRLSRRMCFSQGNNRVSTRERTKERRSKKNH